MELPQSNPRGKHKKHLFGSRCLPVLAGKLWREPGGFAFRVPDPPEANSPDGEFWDEIKLPRWKQTSKKSPKKTLYLQFIQSRALLRLSCLLPTQTYASYQLCVSHGIHLGAKSPCKTNPASVVSHSLISFHNSHFINPFPDTHFSITFAADFFTLPHPGVSIPGWGQLTSFKDSFATDHRSQPQFTMPHFTTK